MTELLVMSLEAAVPLRMAELATLDPEDREPMIREWAALAADLVSQNGDQLMFRTPVGQGQPGTAAVFNALAKGLAALAYQPGGVRFHGAHWDAHAAEAEREPS